MGDGGNWNECIYLCWLAFSIMLLCLGSSCLCKCIKERDLPLRLFFNGELYCSILCIQVIVEVLKDKKLHLSPCSPAPLQLYGLLKVHKSNTPLRTFGDRLPNKPVVWRILTPIPALLSRILWILLNIYMYITQFWRRWQDDKFQCCEPFTKVPVAEALDVVSPRLSHDNSLEEQTTRSQGTICQVATNFTSSLPTSRLNIPSMSSWREQQWALYCLQ